MRWVLICAGILGASSVIIGAALRHLGGDVDMGVLQTALRYHQLHSVALLALGLFALDKPASLRLIIPAALFVSGVLIFSGCLYAMQVLQIPVLGNFTPVGGVMLILGWCSCVFLKFS